MVGAAFTECVFKLHIFGHKRRMEIAAEEHSRNVTLKAQASVAGAASHHLE